MTYTQDDYLYRRLGPWPQPSPDHPQGKAPAVVHIPKAEQRRWDWHVRRRYLTQLFTGIPRAFLRAWRDRTYPPVSDADFSRLLLEGIYVRFLCPTLDPVDEERFAGRLKPGLTYWKMDFTPIRDVKPYPGMHVAQSVVLIREAPAGQFHLEALWIADREGGHPMVLEPGGGEAWELAKYFVMQSAAYGILFTVHPNLHFPFDSINAITKTAVPMKHPLFQLLEPHLDYQLPLNNAVLNSPATVISNNPRTIYGPFTARGVDGLMAFFKAGFAGIPGNSAYPKYDYPENPQDPRKSRRVQGTYGRFLELYYEPFLAFARAVLADLPNGDPVVRDWGDYIHHWIPGFHTGATLASDRDALAEAAAAFMWNVSVAHSVDHADFGWNIPVTRRCLRLRLPPPSTPEGAPFDRADLVTVGDLLRAHLAEQIFFIPFTVVKLLDATYRFTAPAHQRAAEDFKRALRAVPDRLAAEGVPEFIALNDIASSIQY